MKQNTNCVQLNVRVTQTMLNQLQELAEKQHRTLSQVVRMSLLHTIELDKTFNAMPSVYELAKKQTESQQ